MSGRKWMKNDLLGFDRDVAAAASADLLEQYIKDRGGYPTAREEEDLRTLREVQSTRPDYIGLPVHLVNTLAEAARRKDVAEREAREERRALPWRRPVDPYSNTEKSDSMASRDLLENLESRKQEKDSARTSLLDTLQAKRQRDIETSGVLESESRRLEDALFENPSLSPSMKKRAISVAAILDKMPKSATITDAMANEVWQYVIGIKPPRKRR